MDDAHVLDPYSRIIWTIFNTIGIPLALVGNSVVLYGSMKYNALELGNVLLLMIQTLTVLDLTLVITKWFSSLVTVIVGRWILGGVVCFLAGYVSHAIAITEFSLLASISLYKFYTLAKPLAANYFFTAQKVKTFIGGLVCFCVTYRFAPLLWGSQTRYYHEYMTCEPDDLTLEKFQIYGYITIFGFLTIPTMLIITANIGIILIATKSKHKSSSRVGKKMPGRNAILAVSSVSWLFVISITPISIRIIGNYFNVRFPYWFLVANQQFCYLNFMCNPICYTCTSARFKLFLLSRVLRIRSRRVKTVNVSVHTGNSINSTAFRRRSLEAGLDNK